LVEKRPDDAIEAYRRVVRRRWRDPEAEVAQFAVGQLLFERGATAEAAVAFNDYVARYPMGRFVREAREHLALIRPRK
jgi:outer membrane protein assembly factor BamD (BamD/ComL family)